jgi:hypothetical protein
MARVPGASLDREPIDVRLPDGGHVIVAIDESADDEVDEADGILSVLLTADGSEADLERALVDEAEHYGLTASRLGRSGATTTVVIRSARPR